jgi:hypothetical protein
METGRGWRSQPQSGWTVTLLVASSLWLGLLLGVSFLATPAKFLAANLTLPVALEVGRHTFAIFNKVEWAVAIPVLFVAAARGRIRSDVLSALLLLLVLLAQTLWLLPALDQRVGTIILGQHPPLSSLHSVYVGLECLKGVILAIWIVSLMLRLSAKSGRRRVKSGNQPSNQGSSYGQIPG